MCELYTFQRTTHTHTNTPAITPLKGNCNESCFLVILVRVKSNSDEENKNSSSVGKYNTREEKTNLFTAHTT